MIRVQIAHPDGVEEFQTTPEAVGRIVEELLKDDPTLTILIEPMNKVSAK